MSVEEIYCRLSTGPNIQSILFRVLTSHLQTYGSDIKIPVSLLLPFKASLRSCCLLVGRSARNSSSDNAGGQRQTVTSGGDSAISEAKNTIRLRLCCRCGFWRRGSLIMGSTSFINGGSGGSRSSDYELRTVKCTRERITCRLLWWMAGLRGTRNRTRRLHLWRLANPRGC
jgi:hypothetical protein